LVLCSKNTLNVCDEYQSNSTMSMMKLYQTQVWVWYFYQMSWDKCLDISFKVCLEEFMTCLEFCSNKCFRWSFVMLKLFNISSCVTPCIYRHENQRGAYESGLKIMTVGGIFVHLKWIFIFQWIVPYGWVMILFAILDG
jgi:hypothetical protein